MKNWWAFVLGGLLVAMLIAASVVAILKVDVAPKGASGKRVERTRNLGEGLTLSRHGLYGIDLVSIGRARTRKLRKGPFTIGAINELVLEDVALVLPEEIWREKVEKVGGGGEEREGETTSVRQQEGETTSVQQQEGPRAMLAKLGLEAGLTKLNSKLPRFSAMLVKGLRVSRLEGTNAVPWFAADRAKAERDGLHLYSGWSIENGATNGWKEALLAVEPTLKLWTPQVVPAMQHSPQVVPATKAKTEGVPAMKATP